MNLDHDELAGVVDLFGGLTRAELAEALDELAFRRGEDPPDPDVAGALDAYVLVAYERETGAEAEDEGGTEELLVPGPVAFPTLPEGATDLPHILDVDGRDVDRAALGRAVEERFRADVARAVAAADEARMRELLDVSYELEAWGPVELGEMRERLDDALA